MKNITFLLNIGLVVVLIIGNISCPKPTEPADGNCPTSEACWTWSIDTLVYDGPPLPPGQINIQSIWGSSAHDVWAVGTSDDILGELWHYNGSRWRVVTNWPYNGIDAGGSYLNDVYAVTGFDSANVFLFGIHGYDTTGTDNVLKWNGQQWSVLPWVGGSAPRGALGYGVKQNNDKLWAVSTTGQVVKYAGGFLSVDTVIIGHRFTTAPVIAALDNGEVYVNVFKDSLQGDTLLLGRITKLYRKDFLGQWSLIEEKFIAGSYEDGNGLGSGVLSIGNHLFTTNRGLWERIGNSWIERLAFDNFGGSCLVSENNMWIYFKHELWHFNGKEWIRVDIPLLNQYSGYALYGEGWSDGNEIFIGFHNGGTSYILHGRLKEG
ncbi:MAG: hypothetical protein HYR76_06720 [Ignavibacteria bacterium]|nr:hypothetical protein [Ignavibacteria bacterium]